MITKQSKYNKYEYYDVKVTDKNGKSFIMTVGDNYDLYWLPENQREDTVFEIDKSDKMAFSIFKQLFDAVKKNDDKCNPVLNNNAITFISEDWNEDEANVLNIIKNDNSFVIKFIKNENVKKWSCPHISSAICFCNSGSRLPEVEQVFMRLFNYLAYESKFIQIETVENKHSALSNNNQ